MENENNQEVTNTPEEDIAVRKKWKLRYTLVVAVGLLLIAAVFILTAYFSNKEKALEEAAESRRTESAESVRPDGKAAKTTEADEETVKEAATEEAKEATGEVLAEGSVKENGAEEGNGLAVDVPVDSYYQFANDYDWEDLYTLMILICQSGVGLSEGSAWKHPSFALFSFDTGLDPMLFVGFTDPNTGKSTTTLYITDHGYVYELLKVNDDKVYIDPESGRIMIGSGEVYYRYTPHVLLKTETGSEQIPPAYEELPMTDAISLAVTSENIGTFLNIFEGEELK